MSEGAFHITICAIEPKRASDITALSPINRRIKVFPNLKDHWGYLSLFVVWLLDNSIQKHSLFSRLTPPLLSVEHTSCTDTEWPDVIFPIVGARIPVSALKC